MKKIAIFALVLVLALSLCACACGNMAPATTPTTNVPTTNDTIMPTDNMTIPVPETNIPDRDIGPTGGIVG